MSSKVTKLSSNQVKLDFVVEPEVFEKGIAKAYNVIRNRVNIPGFRKGKAPRKVIELHYGPEIFYDDAFEAIFPDVYREAINEHNVEPVDRPQIEVSKMESGEPLEFSATVYVSPDVELGQYKGVPAVKRVADVTDDDVNAEIERAREKAARFIDVTDRPAKLDDEVDIDYKGFCEGEQFEGGTAEGHKLVLGSGSFIPGFEEQLVGKNVGEEVDVNVTFPEEYHAENLKGKPAVFHVKINAIQEKELPAIDDDFVKEVSEFDTVAEYKTSIRENLTKQAEERADAAFENEVIEEVVDASKVDIPEAMIEDQIDSMIRDFEMRLAYQGMKMDDFLKYSGQTREQMREYYKEEAAGHVKNRLVVSAIRKAEGIEGTPEEIDKEMEKYAESSKKSLEDFKSGLTEEDRKYFAEAVAIRKTIDMLKAEAKEDEVHEAEETEKAEQND